MKSKKIFLLVAIALTMVSIANADLVLTVNGLDTTKPIEVEPNDNIIIAVAGQTDEQRESYSVTCEMGGKLEPFSEPNTLAEEPTLDRYLFTFEDEELGLAIVNLTVGDVLDHQLILFKIPDANTIIFSIDSDAFQTEPEPEPSKVSDVNEPEPEPEPNEPQEPNIPDSLFKPRNEPPPLLLHCPDDSIKPYRLEEFDYSPIVSEENFEASGVTICGCTIS